MAYAAGLPAHEFDDFLALVAHELRAPLASALNAAAVVRQSKDLDARVRTASAVIDRQTRRLARLLDDMLDLARSRHGGLVLRRVSTDVAALLAGTVETVRPVIAMRRQVLRLDVPRRPCRVMADESRLQQVFVNLLTNAATYTPVGGAIHLRVALARRGIAVAVGDTGQGIEPELLPRIFDPYVQGHPGQGRGLGVGLALARYLVELHGGRIEARSEGVGRGSEFIVRLPLDPGDTARPGRRARRAGPPSRRTAPGAARAYPGALRGGPA